MKFIETKAVNLFEVMRNGSGSTNSFSPVNPRSYALRVSRTW